MSTPTGEAAPKANKLIKRVSMDSNIMQVPSEKPKYNSFMMPKSQFLHGPADSDYEKEPLHMTAIRPTELHPNEPFSSYKSHLTLNSSANMFSKEEASAIFEQLSNGQGVIRLETLKAYLFEIGEREQQATSMISLLDGCWDATVKYKDFENFFVGKTLPSKEDNTRLPQELRDRTFRCQFINQHFEVLQELQDPDLAARVGDEFDSVLGYR